MNREILFRGRQFENGKWVLGDLLQYADGRTIIHSYVEGVRTAYEVDPATVGQFAGLVDKNKKRIFEGDIIKTKLADNTEVNASVCFRNGYFTNSLSTYLGGLVRVADGCEVIGNIHDTPDLLQGLG